jgi:para-aminobenzoate synthetase component 1
LTKTINQYIEQHGLDAFKQVCYLQAKSFEYACILDSCNLNTGVYNGNYEFIAGFGAEEICENLDELSTAIQPHKKWWLGVLPYDIKNDFEALTSKNPEVISGDELVFFRPKLLIIVGKDGTVSLEAGSLPKNFFQIEKHAGKKDLGAEEWSHQKSDYIQKIDTIHHLIRNGIVYELNYCLPFTQHAKDFNPYIFQIELLKKSPVPMASFLKIKNNFLCGASMERFLLKKDTALISQPIKGTIKKGDSFDEDQQLIAQLKNSEKDRAENVMIVDLVRNDLGRVCVPGTIQVDELFGIYSYLQVHQMISTVSGTIKSDQSFKEILRATFPMGSMTGAPKISAMQQIDVLEDFKRGWYSGSVGYINPNGNFDFNVVIRSLRYNAELYQLAYFAGGAITIDSEAESEWNEIQLKTKAITELLNLRK